jgi:hypothetical protein
VIGREQPALYPFGGLIVMFMRSIGVGIGHIRSLS